MKGSTTKHPSDVDRHVGARVRARRQLVGMTQSALAEQLGVSFQQVQKYEKGANRIGASRLRGIATALGLGIGFFYEGAPSEPDGEGSREGQVMSDVLARPETSRLLQAFGRIQDPAVRSRIVELAETLAATSTPRAERTTA